MYYHLQRSGSASPVEKACLIFGVVTAVENLITVACCVSLKARSTLPDKHRRRRICSYSLFMLEVVPGDECCCAVHQGYLEYVDRAGL